MGSVFSAFYTQQRPTKSVGKFAQRSRLLFFPKIIEVIKERFLSNLVDTVDYSTQSSCLLQILLKPLHKFPINNPNLEVTSNGWPPNLPDNNNFGSFFHIELNLSFFVGCIFTCLDTEAQRNSHKKAISLQSHR